MTTTLKRSKDRKVSNLIDARGKAKIGNSFGLPAGKQYSCPGATSLCEKVCYAGKAGGIEQIYPNSFKLVLHNWEILRNANIRTMVDELDGMLIDFENECEKWQAEKKFRIHWDGDFFSKTYINAWQVVVAMHKDVQFWAYSRVADAVEVLNDYPNMSIYFSGDVENYATANRLSMLGYQVAWLGQTFEQAKALGANSDRRVISCLEQLGNLSLNGACIECGLCLKGRYDIAFSISKK